MAIGLETEVPQRSTSFGSLMSSSDRFMRVFDRKFDWGVPVTLVNIIDLVTDLYPVPNSTKGIVGFFKHKGEAVPLLDLSCAFLNEPPLDTYTGRPAVIMEMAAGPVAVSTQRAGQVISGEPIPVADHSQAESFLGSLDRSVVNRVLAMRDDDSTSVLVPESLFWPMVGRRPDLLPAVRGDTSVETLTDRYLSMNVSGLTCLLPLTYVQYVSTVDQIDMQPTASSDHPMLTGWGTIQDELVPIFALSRLLDADPSEEVAVAKLQIEGRSFGLVCRRVSRLTHVPTETFRPFNRDWTQLSPKPFSALRIVDDLELLLNVDLLLEPSLWQAVEASHPDRVQAEADKAEAATSNDQEQAN